MDNMALMLYLNSSKEKFHKKKSNIFFIAVSLFHLNLLLQATKHEYYANVKLKQKLSGDGILSKSKMKTMYYEQCLHGIWLYPFRIVVQAKYTIVPVYLIV